MNNSVLPIFESYQKLSDIRDITYIDASAVLTTNGKLVDISSFTITLKHIINKRSLQQSILFPVIKVSTVYTSKTRINECRTSKYPSLIALKHFKILQQLCHCTQLVQKINAIAITQQTQVHILKIFDV